MKAQTANFNFLNPNSFSSSFLHQLLLPLPPSVTDIAADGKRCEHQIENSGVEALARFFTQLRGSLGTNRALTEGRYRCSKKEKTNSDQHKNFLHLPDFPGKDKKAYPPNQYL